MFGSHNHYTSKSVLWIRDGWLKFALNPVFGARGGNNYVQYLSLVGFHFNLGVVLPWNSYGYNKEFLGLYNYTGEDK